MNISAGGPHILLFERDQQLAALFTSELQLAGYECHIARTAVEVFDAIARFSVRLVLVNLAQAAASRREFWVALDTQRRGSGIQVFTFHCSNLAGYGPRDSDDYSQASMADMEIDGMLGLMKLVETIRLRVPGAEVTTPTMPRMPRPSSRGQGTTPSPIQQQAVQSANHTHGDTASYRFGQTSGETPNPTRSRMAAMSQSQSSMHTPTPTQATSPTYLTTSPATELPGGSQATYSDKIRAVLYPNPHSSNQHSSNPHAWSSPENTSPPTPPSYVEQDAIRSYTPPLPQNPAPTSSSQISALQRLATGQIYSEPGLAQLSRLVQGYQPFAREETSGLSYQSSWVSDPRSVPTHMSTQAIDYAGSNPQTYEPPTTRPLQPNEFSGTMSAPLSAQAETSTSSPQDKDYQLRAAPIQDLPLERSTGNQTAYESTKRPDANSRVQETPSKSIPHQPTSQPLQAAQSPLASIATAMSTPTLSSSSTKATPSAPNKEQAEEAMPLKTEPPFYREDTAQSRRIERTPEPPFYREDTAQSRRIERTPEPPFYREDTVQSQRIERTPEPPFYREDTAQSQRIERTPEPPYQEMQPGKDIDESTSAKNAVILDILQSLPVIATSPNQQEQAVLPQIHNGRATRSLGHVLLDGHLVPQDRLEVAQSIQRMLRGVDLNYQLGEILLMFKLLTPDQLLAASLVSYGLITRTQISALGRIRQELHAIGLEYDLENLVILFRILSPEQLREARSNVQG